MFMDKVPQPIRSFLLMTGLILATNTPGLDSQEEECQTIPCLTAKASGLKEDLNTCEASLNTESAKLAAAILEGQQCTEKTDGLSRRLSEAEAKLPPLGEAAEKLRVVRDRQPENSQISSGIMLAGDVFLGIYQTHPSLTLEAPLSGITQFNLIVKPHVFTGNRQLSKDREFFIRAELINPKAQALWRRRFPLRLTRPPGAQIPACLSAKSFPRVQIPAQAGESADGIALGMVTTRPDYVPGLVLALLTPRMLLSGTRKEK